MYFSKSTQGGFYDPRQLTPRTRVCVRIYDHDKNYIEDDDDDRGYMFLGLYNRDPFPTWNNYGCSYPMATTQEEVNAISIASAYGCEAVGLNPNFR